MRTTSTTWKQLVQRGEFHMETVARIYGATGDDPNGVAGSDSRGAYKQYATITAPTIKHGLLPDKTLSVGNCVAGTLSFTLMTTDKLPKSAKVVIRSRVTDGKLQNPTKSEWLEFGTYWIDHRQVNENLIDLECYDAMKMGNQAYDDDSQVVSWPKKIKVVLQRIATQMGVSFDSRTVDYVINSDFGDLNIVTKPNDDEVLLDVLGYIGGILGGNWYITEKNKLRFVQLITRPPETAFLLDSNYDYIQTDQDDYIIHEGESTEHVDITNPAGGGVLKVPVVIGSITNADLNVISRVTMIRDSNHVYTYGDDTGVTVLVNNNPYATDALCEALYDRLNGVEYAPYEMTNAIYDPATELGDYVYAGDRVRSVNFIMERTFDIGFSSTLAAPSEDELENEYPFQSIERRVQYATAQAAENRTLIQQTQDDIQLIAEAGGSVRSAFAIDPASVTITAGESGGQYTGTITFNGGALVVNSDNFRVTSEGVLWCRGATIEGYSTDEELDGLERSVTATIDDYGARLEAVESYVPTETSVRSLFELDPHNITLSAGIDESGKPTGTITFNAGALIVNGSNFRLYSDGHMWCRGADIEGYATSVSINELGVRMTSIETDLDGKVSEDSVRSAFALDPHNVTIEAGYSSGEYTGTITFNSGALVVNSDNFELTSDGVMKCTGAEIKGSLMLYGTSSNPTFRVTTDGVMTCKGADIKGKFTSETVDEETGNASRVIFDNAEIDFYDVNDNKSTRVARMLCWVGNRHLTIEGDVSITTSWNSENATSIRVYNNGIDVLASALYVRSGSSFGTGYNGSIKDGDGRSWNVVNGIICT